MEDVPRCITCDTQIDDEGPAFRECFTCGEMTFDIAHGDDCEPCARYWERIDAAIDDLKDREVQR